jgi:hypothetical protein
LRRIRTHGPQFVGHNGLDLDALGERVSVTSVGGTDVYAGRMAVDLTTPKRLPLVGLASE